MLWRLCAEVLRVPRAPLAHRGWIDAGASNDTTSFAAATAQQRQEYANRYENYIVIVYSTLLGHVGGKSFTVLGSGPSEEGVIVTSRIDGIVSIGVDWLLNPTNNGYKVTNLLVGGIDMASLQRSDLVSVVQRNSGQVQALLVALRVKNASYGILR
jgi:ABC-type transporter MlaC component